MAVKKKKAKTTPSSVCRVNKNGNYTIMSNYHLRSKNLSLKAIGLMSKVLSLPDEWDYSIAGLTAICKEEESAIKSALKELKDWGYLSVTKLMPNETASGRIEYVYDFYEYSEKDKPDNENNVNAGDTSLSDVISKKSAKQGTRKQDIEFLPLEIQPVEIQDVENQGQLNTKQKIQKKELLSDQISTNQSFSPDSEKNSETVSKTDGMIDRYLKEQQIYTDIVKANIEYDDYVEWLRLFGANSSVTLEELGEVVGMIVRAICSPKKSERICGQDFPREVIKSAMLKVDRTCLDNAFEVMRTTDNIRNYEKYLISTLFNEANGRHFKENAEERNAEYAVKRDFGRY
jgi:hypothetical protein